MSIADIAIAAVLFAHAVLGHFALVLRSHNWWYGSGLDRKTVDVLQVLHGLVFLAGVAMFWFAAGFDLRTLFRRFWTSPMQWLEGYVMLCWFVSFLVIP